MRRLVLARVFKFCEEMSTALANLNSFVGGA
jgi:hypothetical protein